MRTTKILVTILGLFITSNIALAQDIEIIGEGTTGDCTWTKTSDGVLRISGSGAMADYGLGNDAPTYIYNVTSVVVGDSVTVIGTNAFNGAYAVSSIKIGNAVTTIKDYAFGLNNLSVTFGSSVTTIGAVMRTNFTEITSYAINPPVVTNYTFYTSSKTIPVYVPKCAIEAYQATDYWCEFTNIIGIESELCEDTTTSLIELKTDKNYTYKYFYLSGIECKAKPVGVPFIQVTYENGKPIASDKYMIKE